MTTVTSSMRIEKDIRPLLERLRAKSGLRTYSQLLTQLVLFMLNNKDILDKFVKLQEDTLLAQAD